MKLTNSIYIIGLFLLTSCTTVDSAHGDRIKIVTTTNILGSMVEALAPEEASVDFIMKAGVDPHGYKASQGDIEKLINADIVFYQGLYLEGKMINILKQLNRTIPTIEVSSILPRTSLIIDDSFPDAVDPHIWFSIPLWIQCVNFVSSELIKVIPQYQDEIIQNTEDYLLELEKLHVWALSKVEEIPIQQRYLISAHDAFSYFGQDFSFKIYSLQGISTLSDFGLKSLKEIGEIIIAHQIPAIFLESSVSDRSIQALISGVIKKGYPLKTGGVLFSDSLGPKGSATDNYFTMYMHNISIITQALKDS